MLNAREPGKGGKHSEESRRLMGDSQRGKKHNEVTKSILAQKSAGNSYAKGHIHTAEARRKISEKQSGVKWALDRRLRAKGKKKTLKGPRIKDRTVYRFENILTGEVFEGIRHDFKVRFSLPQESVHRLVSGEYQKTKGWILAKCDFGKFIPGTQYVVI